MPPIQNNFDDPKAGFASSGGAWHLFLFFLSIFLILFVGYLGLLLGYKPFLTSQIKKSDAALTSLASEVSQNDQESFLRFYFQLINIRNILKDHVYGSRILSFIQAHTNKSVYFSSLNFSAAESTIALEGFADSYGSLIEQLQVFASANELTTYSISNASFEKGLVKFRVSLLLKPASFKG